MSGFILLNRDIINHWIFLDAEYFRSWANVILMCNFSDKTEMINHELRIVKRGSFFASYRKLGNNWNWGKNRVVKFFELLEKDHMIKTESEKAGTLVTVLNYDEYQGKKTPQNTTSGHQQDTSEPCDTTGSENNVDLNGTQTGHPEDTYGTPTTVLPLGDNTKKASNKGNKENNKDKEEKPVDLGILKTFKKFNTFPEYVPYKSKDLIEAINAFLEFRNKNPKSKVDSDYCFKLHLKKLVKLCGTNEQLAIAVIEQSIESSWKAFFPLNNPMQIITKNQVEVI